MRIKSLIIILIMSLIPGCMVDEVKTQKDGLDTDTPDKVASTIDSSVFKGYPESLKCLEYKSVGGPPGSSTQIYSYSHYKISGIQLHSNYYKITVNDSSTFYTSYYRPSETIKILDSTIVRSFDADIYYPQLYEGSTYPLYYKGEMPKSNRSDTTSSGMNRISKGATVVGDTIKLYYTASGYKYSYNKTWIFVIGRGFIKYEYARYILNAGPEINTFECE